MVLISSKSSRIVPSSHNIKRFSSELRWSFAFKGLLCFYKSKPGITCIAFVATFFNSDSLVSKFKNLLSSFINLLLAAPDCNINKFFYQQTFSVYALSVSFWEILLGILFLQHLFGSSSMVSLLALIHGAYHGTYIITISFSDYNRIEYKHLSTKFTNGDNI